jgi:hypothetical protein
VDRAFAATHGIRRVAARCSSVVGQKTYLGNARNRPRMRGIVAVRSDTALCDRRTCLTECWQRGWDPDGSPACACQPLRGGVTPATTPVPSTASRSAAGIARHRGFRCDERHFSALTPMSPPDQESQSPATGGASGHSRDRRGPFDARTYDIEMTLHNQHQPQPVLNPQLEHV